MGKAPIETMVGREVHGRVDNVDDCEVTGVTVRLTGKDDATLIEEGPATDDGGFWRYVAKTEAPAGLPLVLEVTATDRAENRSIEKRDLMT